MTTTGKSGRVFGAAILLALLGCLSRIDPRRFQTLSVGSQRNDILTYPISVAPDADTRARDPEPLSSKRWSSIASKFYPNQEVPDVSFLLHHLVNWGITAQFEDRSRALSGGEMLDILTEGHDNRLYAPKRPLLYRGLDGLPRLSRDGSEGSESHPNQVLASLAGLGLPSSHIIHSGTDSATIAELIAAARCDFHLRGEIEWTTIALACYAPTSGQWVNRWGKKFDFDSIAKHLMSRPRGDGVCGGTHTLQALAVILRIDTKQRIISKQVRAQTIHHLAETIRCLESTQRTSGYWAPDWPVPLADVRLERFDAAIFNEGLFVQITGHHLEWLDLLPPELAISERSRLLALAWCVNALEQIGKIENSTLCKYSHCFRVVKLHLSPRAHLEQPPHD